MLKLKSLIVENLIFVPRRSKEERDKLHIVAVQKQIQQYIKNGYKGDLDLRDTPVTSLPNNLTTFGGTLDLGFTAITSLPVGLKIGGNLYLDRTKITSLPDGLEYGKNFNAAWTYITELPVNLKLGDGYVSFYNTPLANLPDNLHFRKSLDLENTRLSNLPKGLRVDGILDIRGTQISELPSDLRVGDNLFIGGTPLYRKYTIRQLKQMVPFVTGEIRCA